MPVFLAALVVALPFGGPTGVAAREGAALVEQADSARGAQRPFKEFWVAAHTATTLWAGAAKSAARLRPVPQWAVMKVVRPQEGARLYVWDQDREDYGWVDARDVGPYTSGMPDPTERAPSGVRVIWKGDAKITMYTCVELGGCGRTASGIRPRPGIVAVDPKLIPLGSRVWIEGLGTFVAADTGGAVKGAHVDVFSTDHPAAVRWGMKRRQIVAFTE